MAVYTDGVHLVADTENELHKFASEIGVSRKLFQYGRHSSYPLIGNTVNKALLCGAILKESREILIISKDCLPEPV